MDRPEWSIAILSPNLDLKCDITCGVKDISGTSIIAVLPFWSISSITFIYTSVFPLPVTPNNRYVCGSFKISSTTDCWVFVRVIFLFEIP